jgi:putative transposase
MTMDLNDLQIIANTDLNTYINAHSVPGNTIAELYTNELNSQASASGLANVVNQASYLQNLFLNATPDAVASNMTSKIIAERQDPNIDFSVGGTDKLKFEWKFLQIDAQARINDINDGGTGELTVEQFNANMMIGQGKTMDAVLREIGVTGNTYYRWRKEYGGMGTDQARRLKELENENARLKRAVADLTLDNLILKEVSTGKF